MRQRYAALLPRRLFGSRRRIAIAVLGIAVITAGGVALRQVLFAGVPIPAYGAAIGPQTRTCIGSKVDGTPKSGLECSGWDASGPVNVIISVTDRDPYRELLDSKQGWHSAQGNWLVLQGYTDEKSKDSTCEAGWRDSTRQIELRIDKVTRRHFKFIYSACSEHDGTTVIIGEAHTDKYDVQKCGGDYITDFNQARDALVTSFSHVSGTSVEMLHIGMAKGYPSGCKSDVQADDGVAHITMS